MSKISKPDGVMPAGATLNLGGRAWAHPDLQPALSPIEGKGDPTPSLVPYPGNPRRGDQPAITASIRDLGLYRTLIVQRSTGHVLAGNHTLRALIDLGATLAPVTWVDVDDDRARAIVARDNRTSDLGEYDDRELLDLLEAAGAAEGGLALAGYDDDPGMLLLLQRRAEAEGVFTEGVEGMLDEFRGASGQDSTDYAIEYARKVTVYLRDDEAITAFRIALGLPDEPLEARLHLPLGWEPYDRRRTWQAERDGEQAGDGA